MNIHKNARLTFTRRLEMVHQITQERRSIAAAAACATVSEATARKWLSRSQQSTRDSLPLTYASAQLASLSRSH
jgi:transposase-like protein